MPKSLKKVVYKSNFTSGRRRGYVCAVCGTAHRSDNLKRHCVDHHPERYNQVKHLDEFKLVEGQMPSAPVPDWVAVLEEKGFDVKPFFIDTQVTLSEEQQFKESILKQSLLNLVNHPEFPKKDVT